ncbi:low molecular weight protein-tyrosine-phosphatase [Phyllobacterium zundukense]|uniref:protein-tyrosine-phosphatase n=1 Tax=Phyllobacterium zundukense TaxID=1867719 RepID=A0A2N9VWN0_9HYPH|nr:low molecular weight protein-tyrosine-phosphatase [Phyllobacterium zundukense]ATU93472.1 phosphotyrosine protein phosphatase [Phyllobacterium zundukense]PIO43898.1 phosphotyrosine protein phosphatase [Phyllobacterium zundukense]
MKTRPLRSVLFVCLGNICRSPLAEGVFRTVLEAEEKGEGAIIDSAGTNGYHTGEAPDQRSIAVASRHGIDISNQRCRQLTLEDYTRFDLIVGMDHANVVAIEARRPLNATAEIGLFYEMASRETTQIPDPYYGTNVDFERVYRMILAASKGLSKLF